MLSVETLVAQNVAFHGTCGRSQENRGYSFRPAFLDTHSGTVYPSTFSDGRLAPIHILDGLPQDVVLVRSQTGKVIRVHECVVSGFERDGQFFTREEAATALRAA